MATVKLHTATIRGRLPKGRWHYDTIAKGVALGYYRGPKPGKDGSWCVRYRAAKGRGGAYYSQTNIGAADDITERDGVTWLDYREAVEAALAKARREMAAPDQPLTVGAAVETYIARRIARGTGRPKDEETALAKYFEGLFDKRVATLDHATLLALAHKTPRRVCRTFRAALNQTPINIRPTNITLGALKDHRPEKRRRALQAVMDDRQVAATEATARRHDHTFGLLVAVLATTGCRPGQIVRCRVGDLLASEGALNVPPSAKGKDPLKPKPYQRLPLDPALAHELAAMVRGRPSDAPLFETTAYIFKGRRHGWQAAGTRAWNKIDWHKAWTAAGLKGKWQLYDLRHAAIVRMLLAGVPIKLVAAKLDTGVAVIERVYSRWITDPNDAFLRKALTPRALTVVAS
jgi:integrase